MRIVKMTDLVKTPWKNGGGITRNIAAQMDGAAVLWRLSMADVTTAGPFSAFPGLTRILTVINGDGMILHAPEGDLRADFASPVTFDGASAITAELTAGPLRDFNLMFDTRRCDGSAAAVGGPVRDATLGGAGKTAVLHCITATAAVNGQTLASGDTAIAENSTMCYSLPEEAVALAISLKPRDPT